MLKIDISIWPYGDRNKAKLIKTLTIANIGGDLERGFYSIKLYKEGTDLEGEHKEWYPKYLGDYNVEKKVKTEIERKIPIENFVYLALKALTK